MLRTHRSTLRQYAALTIAAVIATGCGDVPEPTAPLSPTAQLAERGRVVPTHPATGTLALRVSSFNGRPFGLGVSSRGVVLTGEADRNDVGGFALDAPTAARTPVGVGGLPLDVIFNRIGSLAYVSVTNTGNISLVDVRSNTLKDSIPVGPDPYRLLLTPDESRLYVTTLNGRLWSIRTRGDRKPIFVDLVETYWPLQGIALSPSGADLYVASTKGTIWRLDPATLAVRQSATFFGRPIQDIALSPDGSALWAADENGSVMVLDPTTLALTSAVSLGAFYGRPFGLAVSPDGARVYATSPTTGQLFIIDQPAPGSYNVSVVEIGGVPRRIGFGENGAAAVISNEYNWVDIVR